MGGKGEGTSPEDLLVCAVANCYTATLGGLLARDGLPVDGIRVAARGIVASFPLKARISEIRVIGTGEAGSAVATGCRAAGWEVAIVDSRDFGGTCGLRGCDPKGADRRGPGDRSQTPDGEAGRHWRYAHRLASPHALQTHVHGSVPEGS
jgi:hypothetical protein